MEPLRKVVGVLVRHSTQSAFSVPMVRLECGHALVNHARMNGRKEPARRRCWYCAHTPECRATECAPDCAHGR